MHVVGCYNKRKFILDSLFGDQNVRRVKAYAVIDILKASISFFF